jgi:hypothetical protein
MRRKLYIYRAMANAKTNQLDVALADLKEVLRLDPEDATAIRYQASVRHLLAARFANKGPSRYVPTLLSQDRFLTKAGEVGNAAYKSRFEDTLYDCRRDRQYPEFKRKGKAFMGERESSEEEEEAEPEEPSPWDYILRRVRDILVDGDDERQTRALLLEHVGTLVVMYVYYCRLGSQNGGSAGKFQAIHPVRIMPKRLTAKALARFDSLFTVTGLPPYLISLRQFWQFAKDCGVVGDECSAADCSRIFVLASREFDPEEFASLFPYWQRQGFRTGSLATPEVGAYLAENFGFMLDHPGFGNETMLLRAPEPDEAVADYGTGLDEPADSSEE